MPVLKRRRGEDAIDLTANGAAAKRLGLLKAELENIRHTPTKDAIRQHILALEEIIDNKSPVNVTAAELVNLGVVRKRLYFPPGRLTSLLKRVPPSARKDTEALDVRIFEILFNVNMESVCAQRMVIDAIILFLARMTRGRKIRSVVFPTMKPFPSIGVTLANPASGYEVQLTGELDYVVFNYKDARDHRARLTGADGSKEDAFDIAKGFFFLVQHKPQAGAGDHPGSLASQMPRAVGQALALAKLTGHEEVRFCLSNGHTWIFAILRKVQGQWVYCESSPRQLDPDGSDKPLYEILAILLQWVSFCFDMPNLLFYARVTHNHSARSPEGRRH
ncbi:hypothetical protein BDN70DRAFT_814932 [Pholiota conissans]|uniref:Uncharacterized protein n=1 Tax=Pholiota conissans TaxID=109636 RepID=A0A9P6CVM5_9AGAR|nr:hypothetical protein BDN70DRAFT_814932 [Pholiota conissans]